MAAAAAVLTKNGVAALVRQGKMQSLNTLRAVPLVNSREALAAERVMVSRPI